MIRFFILFHLILSSSVFATDTSIKLRSKGMVPLCDPKSHIEITNLPPVLDQGPFGTCYAHSSLLLLDYHRCSRTKDPAACYSDRGSVMHMARFNDYYVEKLDRGGEAKDVLKYFQEKGRKLVRERCAPYASWELLNIKLNEGLTALPKPKGDKKNYDYFAILASRLKKGATEEEKRCWAQEIIDNHVRQNVNDLIAIMGQNNRQTVEQLRYKILVPEKCSMDTIEYPPYEQDFYPAFDKTFEANVSYVQHALSLGLPVEAGTCSTRDRSRKCISAHSTTIVGQRYVCNSSKCELQFRLQNSYGKAWQENNDDGWIDAKTFVGEMREYGFGFTTISPKGVSLKAPPPIKLIHKSPITPKTPTKPYGKEKCFVLES